MSALIASWQDVTDACHETADLVADMGLEDLDWQLLQDGLAAGVKEASGEAFDPWFWQRSLHRLPVSGGSA